MRIIYGFSNCTDKTYNRIMSEKNASAMQPDQKYHGLMIKGLAENGAELVCFSGLPVNRSVTSRKLVREKDEREGNALYHYITTVNFPVIRQLMIFFGAFFGVLRTKKDDETYAVCDFLNTATAAAFILACKLKRVKKAVIVTDLPDMVDTGRLRKAAPNLIMRRFDGYVFLTEYMSSALKRKKPYIVMEGHADGNVPLRDDKASAEARTGRQVVLYAGSIQSKYGIGNLAEGFVKAELPNAELRVFGSGDFRERLIELGKSNPNVRYMGVADNSEIVAQEQSASLLVNPRPTSHEFTKYSFPSKNMEYMASGTPLLTTKLAGMPAEYYPYVYLIEEETACGIASALTNILNKPLDERNKKGLAAREFVLKSKSNTAQAKRLIEFLPCLKKKQSDMK